MIIHFNLSSLEMPYVNLGEQESDILYDDYLQHILQYINDTKLEKKVCDDLKGGLVDEKIVEKHKDFYFEQFQKIVTNAKEIVDNFNFLNAGFNLFNLEDDDFKTQEECDRPPFTVRKKKVQDILEPYLIGLIEKCSEEIMETNSTVTGDEIIYIDDQ